MGFEEIIQAIINYGITPVIFGLVVWIIIYLIKENKKRSEELTKEKERLDKKEEEQGEKMALIIKGILETHKEVHTKEEEDKNRRVNSYIDMQLDELVTETGANRAYVFLYHNGGHDITGRGFQKMSISNESVDLNTVPIMGSYQNIPRTMFPTVFNTLSDENVYYILNVEDIKKTDAAFYQLLLTHGVKSALIHGIKRDMDGMVLGFVVLEFIGAECKALEETKENLELKTMKISGALIGKDIS